MKEFFEKYAKHMGERPAYKLIAKQIQKAIDADEKGGDPLHCLAIASEMIEDIFEVKGEDSPAKYLKK